MALIIWASGILHFAIIAGLLGVNTWWLIPKSTPEQQVYRVNLLTLPDRPPLRRPLVIEKTYKVVSKKEAAVPQKEASLALEKIPELVSEVPSVEPEAYKSFETESPSIRLDEQVFEFPYYLSIMQRKIQQNFVVPRMVGIKHLEVIIYFRVDPSGRIFNIMIESSSDNPFFDLAAQRALKAAGRLPPLPGGYTKPYLGVHFTFQYSL